MGVVFMNYSKYKLIVSLSTDHLEKTLRLVALGP
jgi:hypothetical protein